jgi:LuxR family maltose regulon positive regulatory protein
MDTGIDPGLVLKITPPKLRKSLLLRERLRGIPGDGSEAAVLLVEAPAGHGKTSLLAQWRLDWMQSGVAVSWLSLDHGDTAVSVVSGVVEGLRRATGRRKFGLEAVEAIRRGADANSALTSLLAEITEAAVPMVLVFDNLERVITEAVHEVFDYLLHNLPPNLQVAFGSRPPAPLRAIDLLGSGTLRRITPEQLRLDLAETIRLLTTRLGNRVDPDTCARLHELTAGWPLGLQIAASALEAAVDPAAAIAALAASREDTTRRLFDNMLNALPPPISEFVTTCGLLDALHPSLCEAITGEERAGLFLQQLLVETPLLSATEDGAWIRFHPLAREYLRTRAERQIPEAARRDVHVRAWRWLAAHGSAEPAAQHALAAGMPREAITLIARTLNDEFERGHDGTVGEWLARMSPMEIDQSPDLRLLSVWMKALQYRPDDAVQEASRLMCDAAVDEVTRGEALIAKYVALTIAERVDDVGDLETGYTIRSTELRGPRVHANLMTGMAIYRGSPELGRREQERNPDDGRFPILQMYGDYFVGLSYLWEGRPILAEEAVRRRHALLQRDAGRRGQWTAMLGAILAAACWQRDLREEARALLADRLDVIDRATLPDGIIHAYRTLARIALSKGNEARAFAYLEALEALGERRGLPRLTVSGLAERARVHAARQRPDQAASVLSELSNLVERATLANLFAPLCRLELMLTRSYVSLASSDLQAAGTHAARAMETAKQLSRGYEIVQLLGLQAVLAERAGSSPDALLREALSRAEAGGLVRVFADSLPRVTELVQYAADANRVGPIGRGFVESVLAATAADHIPSPPVRVAGGSAMLTPREQAVLDLLAGGLPNKRIGSELGLSGDTVKWHLKNLFAKLGAGSREHAVARARMLGLLR